MLAAGVVAIAAAGCATASDGVPFPNESGPFPPEDGVDGGRRGPGGPGAPDGGVASLPSLSHDAGEYPTRDASGSPPPYSDIDAGDDFPRRAADASAPAPGDCADSPLYVAEYVGMLAGGRDASALMPCPCSATQCCYRPRAVFVPACVDK